MKKQPFRLHEAVKIRSGELAGLVGIVTEARESSARVHIQGVVDGAPVDVEKIFKPSQLEHAPL